MQKPFRKSAKIALVLVYLVIIAGAVVRMTGSGMGCPDWPKCFGYYIPPTEISELQFKPNHAYDKGIIIIKDETLLVATEHFNSSEILNLNNWESYTAHDYAQFNATHTWVEYINRLLGALSGIPILIFTILSFWLWRKNKWLTILSIATVFGMAFQAWLGKTVVDSNLAPFKITVHMVMAMVIVAIVLYLIYASKLRFRNQVFDVAFRNVILVALALSLVQIVLGTQVRQHIDERVKDIGYIKSLWMEHPTLQFYVHRSFSVLILVINGWLFFRSKKLNLGYVKTYLLMLCILAEIISGIAMFYFDFPFLSQPLHLVIALIMFGIQFYIYLESKRKKALLT
ncbi:heme A synthase [Psychroserpens burtonensis]|uniref:Heme A synthase n=1 Tax=Psychroserpens burtonensis TaxID=49278 RepID=A0A5C7BD27_9FLAO|nr:COX15/CtaA family protein [Psychroserpens burtonensis]TXE16937.1 heme A synthase [Psychroserpens burtonensis]